MFEPLEIIYASPLLMKVAFTAGLVAAVALAATFLTMAIMDLRGDPVAAELTVQRVMRPLSDGSKGQ